MKSDQKIHFSNVKSLYKGQQIIRNGLKLKLRLQGALKVANSSPSVARVNSVSSYDALNSRAAAGTEMLPAA